MEKNLKNKDRWVNRRSMTWSTLISGILFPLLILFTESEQLGAIAAPFYIFVTGVVGSYMGFATVDDKWQKNDSN